MPLHNTNTVTMAQLVFKVTVVVWSGEQLGLNHVVAAGLKGKRVEVARESNWCFANTLLHRHKNCDIIGAICKIVDC